LACRIEDYRLFQSSREGLSLQSTHGHPGQNGDARV
jgi:hypothetical protein